MRVVARLSTEEASLILQLIEFAENNDFFEPEFDERENREAYDRLRRLACGLKEKLTSVDGSVGKEATARGKTMNVAGPIAMENGRPWWDVSEVRLGFKPFELRKRVKELCGELAGLIFYSDSLETRQSMLEAVYMLRSVERSPKASPSTDTGEAPTSR